MAANPIRVIVRAERRRRGDAPRPRRRGAGRPPGRRGRRRRPRHALPLLGEAVPGAAARASPTTTPTRASSRSPRPRTCADREQLAAVRMLLGRAHAGEDDLECGREGHPPSRLKHNCSGKHAGMLAVCRARGWRTEGYRLAEPPDAAHQPPQRRRCGATRRGRDRDRGRRLRRPDVRPRRSSGWPTMFTRLEASARGRARRRRDARAPGADPRRRRAGHRRDADARRRGREGRRRGPALRRALRTGRASRSRARTAPAVRSARPPRRSSRVSAPRFQRLYELPIANSRGENVGAIAVE